MHVVWNRHDSLKSKALRGHWEHEKVKNETHSEEKPPVKEKHMHGSAVAKNYGVTTIQILRSVPVVPEK